MALSRKEIIERLRASAAGVRNRADAQAAKWAARFGLTPVDRRHHRPHPTPTTGPRQLPHLIEQ